LTFVATANAVAYTGATPVFCDVASTLEPWISARSVRAALGERTRAIMNMAYGGHPGETEELSTLARGHTLTLLEDATHAPGARVGDRQIGTFGLAGAFSFFSNKNLPAGEGGIVVTDDGAVAERVRLLRSHGMTAGTWARHRDQSGSYDVVARGFNYRIDEMRSALASARLARLESDNSQRAEIVTQYRRALENVAGVTPTLAAPEGARSANHLFTVVVDDGIDRDRFRHELADRGVQTSVHYPPVHRFSIYRGDCSLPVTDTYARRSITLPLFAHMSEEQRDHVTDSIRSVLDSGHARPGR
jgi:dTDP-4-amino-4,6-dideoxygalactose transaminase